jgi:hypothetical protein
MREPRDPLLKVVIGLGSTMSALSFFSTLGFVIRLGALWPSADSSAQVGLWVLSSSATPAAQPDRAGAGRNLAVRDTLMILPQVHLRKPCYDFYFL